MTIDLAYSGAAVLDTDYTLATGMNATSTGQIIIPAGAVSGYVTVIAIQDTIDELDETITAMITTVTNALTGNINEVTTILDDDILTLEVTVNTGAIVESGGVAIMIAILSGGTSIDDVIATFSYAGTANTGDYTTSSGSVVIPAGSTTGEITFTATQDLLLEGNESIDWTLTSVTNANTGSTTTGSLVLIDDEVNLPVNISVNTGSIVES